MPTNDPRSTSMLCQYKKMMNHTEIRKEYQKCIENDDCLYSLLLINIFLCAVVYPPILFELIQYEIPSFFLIPKFIFMISSFVLSWLSSFLNFHQKRNEWIQGLALCMITCMLSFDLMSHTYQNELDESNSFYQFPSSSHHHHSHDGGSSGGMSENSVQVIPAGASCRLILIPLAFMMITKEYRIGLLLLNLFIVLASLIVSSWYLIHSFASLAIILCYLIFGPLIIFDRLQHHLLLFFIHRKLIGTILDQERSAEEGRRNEMRHMIANIAHDLKSPLASFMAGIEIISDDIQSAQQELRQQRTQSFQQQQSSTSSTSVMVNAISSIKLTAQNMQNINNFMMMTINRCLDYTKASTGIKLQPKYETLSLKDTLSLPIQCMTNVQQKIQIHLLPFPVNLCSFIISDKQWLQENLLCLLSNAVKYSSQGEVTISLRLKPFPARKRTDSQSQILIHSQDLHATTTTAEHLTSVEEGKPAFLEGNEEVEEEQMTQQSKSISDEKLKPSPRTTLLSVATTTSSNQIYKIVPTNTSNPALPPATRKSSFHGITQLFSTKATDSSSSLPLFLLFEIEDTGIGMSDEAREHLFNPFKQNQRLAGGTGLGLYSLSKRIDSLGGYYGVDKRKDGQQGSMFWFAIPYKPDQESEALAQRSFHSTDEVSFHQQQRMNHKGFRSISPEQSTHRVLYRDPEVMTAVPRSMSPGITSKMMSEDTCRFDPIVTTPSQDEDHVHQRPQQTAKYHILLADDTPSVVKMMSRMLEKQGHCITVAENGAIAFDLVKASMTCSSSIPSSPGKRSESPSKNKVLKKFDVVLMDLQMPVMDGLESTKRIRAYEKEMEGVTHFHQPIICVSANSDVETMDEAKKVGIDAFISKPFNTQTFQSTMNQLMNLKSAQDTTHNQQ